VGGEGGETVLLDLMHLRHRLSVEETLPADFCCHHEHVGHFTCAELRWPDKL
jgi:hypothetical protein